MDALAPEQALSGRLGVEQIGLKKDGIAQSGQAKKVMDQRFPPQQDVEPNQIKTDLAFQLPVGLLDVLMVVAAVVFNHFAETEIPVRNFLFDLQGQHCFHVVHAWPPACPEVLVRVKMGGCEIVLVVRLSGRAV